MPHARGLLRGGLLVAALAMLILVCCARATPQPAASSSYDLALRDGLDALSRAQPPSAHAVFFDVDDTLLYSPAMLEMLRGQAAAVLPAGDDPASRERSHGGMLPAVPQIVELAKAARRRGYRVVVLTARPESSANRRLTAHNLRQVGVPFDDLHFSSEKPAYRAQWQALTGMRIALTVGDQPGDVRGAYGAGYASILLPAAHRTSHGYAFRDPTEAVREPAPHRRAPRL